MANKPFNYYFIVATIKHLYGQSKTKEEIIEHFDNILSTWASKYKDYFLCLEHGDSGDNPHYNLIIFTDQSNTNLQKLFKSAIYKKHGYECGPNTVAIRLVHDLPTLICGYLEKEDDVIIKQNTLNLEELKKNVQKIPKKIHRDLIKVTLDTAPFMIFEYIKENGIIYDEKNQPLSSILNRMFIDGYTVMNLIKHSRLIKHALNTLFNLEKETLGDYVEQVMNKDEQYLLTLGVGPSTEYQTYQELEDYLWDNYLEGYPEEEKCPWDYCVITDITPKKIKVKF